MEDILNDDMIDLIYSKIIYEQPSELLEQIRNYYIIKNIEPFLIKYWDIWAINFEYYYKNIIWEFNEENPLYYIFKINEQIILSDYYNEIKMISVKIEIRERNILINNYIKNYISKLSNIKVNKLINYLKRFNNKLDIYTIWHIPIFFNSMY